MPNSRGGLSHEQKCNIGPVKPLQSLSYMAPSTSQTYINPPSNMHLQVSGLTNMYKGIDHQQTPQLGNSLIESEANSPIRAQNEAADLYMAG